MFSIYRLIDTIKQVLFGFFSRLFWSNNNRVNDHGVKSAVENLTMLQWTLNDFFNSCCVLEFLSSSECICLVQIAVLVFIGIMYRKHSGKLKQIEERLRVFAGNSDQLGEVLRIIKTNINSYQHDTRWFGKKFETAEEKVAKSVHAAVSVLDSKGDQHFEMIHESLSHIKKSVETRNRENKATMDKVLQLTESMKDNLSKKVDQVEKGKAESSSKSTATTDTGFYPDYMRRPGRSRDADYIERSIAAAIKRNFTEFHNREIINLVAHKIKEELKPAVESIKVEIYNSSFALKEVIEDAQSVNALLCKNLVVYLTEISEQTVLKILTTTDQIKYCLNYLHENQVNCSQDVVKQIVQLLNEKFGKDFKIRNHRRSRYPDFEGGDEGLLDDEEINLVPNI